MYDKNKSESEIRQRFQTTIPQDIRDKAKLDTGDHLIWKYDEQKDEIKIIKRPTSFSQTLLSLLSKDGKKELGREGEE